MPSAVALLFLFPSLLVLGFPYKGIFIFPLLVVWGFPYKGIFSRSKEFSSVFATKLQQKFHQPRAVSLAPEQLEPAAHGALSPKVLKRSCGSSKDDVATGPDDSTFEVFSIGGGMLLLICLLFEGAVAVVVVVDDDAAHGDANPDKDFDVGADAHMALHDTEDVIGNCDESGSCHTQKHHHLLQRA